MRRNALRVAGEELRAIHPRLLLARLLLAPLPPFVGSRLRAYGLRLAGFTIGPGTVFWGTPTITGGDGLYGNLRIGAGCVFNYGCAFDLEAPLSIGDGVSFGHQVLVMTSTHQIGPAERRADFRLLRAAVRVGDGAWLGSRSTVLPGVTIGAGAVIAAGAVVTRDVEPDTLVGGVPARAIRRLGLEESSSPPEAAALRGRAEPRSRMGAPV